MTILTLLLFISYFILQVSFSVSLNSSPSPPSYFNIGFLFTLEKNNSISPFLPNFNAGLKAFNDINNKHDGILDDILPNTQLRIIHRSAYAQFLRGAIKVGEILSTDPKKAPVMACIGPTDVDTIRGGAPAFQEAAKIPVFNYRDRTALFGRSDLYPNMMRPVPATYIDGQVTASLISQYFGWEKVTVFYASTDSSIYSNHVFKHFSDKYGIHILSSHVVDPNSEDYSDEIKIAIKFGARIFVLFLDPTVGVKLITQGKQLKLFNNGKTQIIGGEELTNTTAWNSLNLPAETLNSLLTGYIGVSYRTASPPGEMKTRFLNDWVNQKSTKGYVDSNGVSHCNLQMDYYNTSYLYAYYPNLDKTKPLKCAGINYTSYKTHTNLESELNSAMYAYDSVISVALGLHYLIYNLSNMNPTPDDLHSVLISKNFSFTGLTGKVQYSTEMTDDQLDIGGRLTGLLYDIVNYVPILINSSSSSVSNIHSHSNTHTHIHSSYESKVVFDRIVNWNSETGFPECNNQTNYIHYQNNGKKSSPCVSFEFQTSKNSFPYDSAPPIIQDISKSSISSLFFFSSIGIIVVLFIGSVIYLYKNRRLVKMNQPILSYMMLMGILLGFIRVFISASEPNSNKCRTRLWLEHLAFQLIFGTLVVRVLRVYLVTCTMKRVKVTEKQCIILVLLSMIITVGFLIALITTDDKNSAVITITQNQREYIQEITCDYDSRNILTGLYVYDLIILFLALVICWLIRGIKSTISNTTILLEGIITTTTISIGTYILLKMIKLDSNTRSFVVGLVICLTLLRLSWVFYSEFIFNLFCGYELDRTLNLRKSEKNILQLIGCGKLSNQIFATSDDDIPGCSIGNKVNGETVAGSSSNIDYMSVKYLEKFRKLKNRDELNHEINRVKEEMQKKQLELGCLENMMFVANQEGSSSNLNSQSKGSRNESGLQSNNNNVNNRYSVESGCRDECDDKCMDLEKNCVSTSPSRMNSDYPGEGSIKLSIKSPI